MATRQLHLILYIHFQKAFDRLLYQFLKKKRYYRINNKALKWMKILVKREKNWSQEYSIIVLKLHVTGDSLL